MVGVLGGEIMKEKNITIGNHKIGDGKPVFIIAELSANHQQDFEIAVKTIKAIKHTGADAIKLQTYTPGTMTLDIDDDMFRSHSPLWLGMKLFDLYKKASTPWEWHPKLKEIGEAEGLIVFSTPFDKTAADFLEKMHIPAYKIASYEITDIPLIEYVASKGKPVIISTGIATLCDIEEAMNACRRAGNNQVALLKCTSAYPTPLDEVNLRTIPNLKETFKTVVGLSDHTLGIAVPIASVALGAKIIEKHFILDRKLGGPDAAFSLEPQEFKTMVTAIREVEKAIGGVNYGLTETMRKSRKSARSLFAVRDIKTGEILTEENVRSIRPGYGMHPKYLPSLLGKKARKEIKKGTPLSWDMVS
jgi:pseudaminic acid synthase